MNVSVTEQKASGLAITSLITGIFGFIPGASLAALICGIIDLVKIKNGQSSPKGRGMDIAGIVLAVVMPIIFWVALWSILIIPFMTNFGFNWSF